MPLTLNTKIQTEYQQTLADFIAHKGISSTGDGVDSTLNFLEKFIKEKLNSKPEIIETTLNPIIYSLIEGQSNTTVLFYGHYDVMSADDTTLWQSEPFTLTTKDNRFYGRGCGDNKGQLMAQLLGIAAYYQEHGTLPFNILLFIEGQEEQGSRDLATVVKRYKDSLLKDVDFALVIDGSINASGQNVVRLGNRGILAFELSVSVADSDLHSGNFGNIAPNAGIKLLGYLNRLYDFESQKTKLADFYNDVTLPSPQEISWIKQLPLPAGITETPLAYYQKLMFQPTFNLNGLHSGHTATGIKTIIPKNAFARFDCRLVFKQDIAKIKASLAKLFAPELDSGDLQLKYLVEVPPSKTSSKSPYIAKLTQAVIDATGTCLIEPIMPGTVPNYVWTDILGVDTFTLPLANFDQNNHAANENITQTAFYNGIKIVYQLLENQTFA
ncbi:M20/M25/M40 family metallo-hydrolase [Ligilactobacillus equi]|uniref:M20/M25/M40 family metallo-hydrolase n=1 Tax=Ligilactobacillus equi TaxID=137357 RepID=UPI002ED4A5C9